MKHSLLYREQLIKTDLVSAWAFFSDPRNLQKITPADMGFDVTTNLGDRGMYEGQIIDYIVRPILGIPLKWRTEIKKVNEPFSFMDVQLMGPYAKWEHTHTFEQVEGGVLIKDKVEYRLPLGIIGKMAHWLFVRSRLTHIFDFRARTIEAYFNK